LHNIADTCRKEWGPKTEALQESDSGNINASPKPPSRTITPYDASIEPADVQALQAAYLFTTEPFNPRQALFSLLRRLAYVYGQSISHPCLRYAICAFSSGYIMGDPSVAFEYSQKACQALKRRLYKPALIDEGDLFATALLTLCPGLKSSEFMPHMEGFMAIMRHLTEMVGGHVESYALAPFWTLVKDEITSFLSFPDEDLISRWSNAIYEVFGHQTFHERTSYKGLLDQDSTSDNTWGKLFDAACRQYTWLDECYTLRVQKPSCDSVRSYIDSVLNGLRGEYVSIDEDYYFDWLSKLLFQLIDTTQAQELRKIEMTLRPSVFGLLDNGLGLLLFALLEAHSLEEGRKSQSAVRASVTAFSRAYRIQALLRRLEVPFLVRWELHGTHSGLFIWD
jgi:hypothetical protein